MTNIDNLGIIAGNGDLPIKIASHISIADNDAHNNSHYIHDGDVNIAICALKGEATSNDFVDIGIDKTKIASFAVTKVGAIMSFFREHGISNLTLAGGVKRPALSSLIPDRDGMRLLARLKSNKQHNGDDRLLSNIIAFLEEEGFNIIASQQLMPGVIAPSGIIAGGSEIPNWLNEQIGNGWKIAQRIGKLDIGQALIYEEGRVLAVEAAEGTAGLITRSADLINRQAQMAFLVKIAKPGQDDRVDLPSIGPDTIRQAYNAGLAAIIIESGNSIIIDYEQTTKLAQQYGLLLVGYMSN